MKNNLNYYISIYFKDYLPNLIGASKNTILSYRDTFVTLLKYLKEHKKMNINKLELDSITIDTISDFLLYLENEKNNCINTRNQRLAAIHSFYNYLKLKELSYMDLCTQILSIPIKKAPKNTISYFSTDEISILINTPDSTEKYGFRDYVLFLFMYETGARSEEIVSLKKTQIQIRENHSLVILNGKGNKQRSVPITKELSDIIIKYFKVFNIENDDYIFKNRQNNQITRKGIEYLLLKYISKAKENHIDKFKQHYSNHSIRHSKAMHLLESGVNLIYIRDFLGHESITTTEIYAKTNPVIKEQQILDHSVSLNINQKYNSNEKEDLLAFLKTL